MLVRLWLAANRTLPILIPDESGYLLAARLLAGGSAADLSSRTFYQAGYPLLLTPLFRLTDDPALGYRLVMVVNALVGASLLVLAFVALRRLGMTRGRAYLLATVTALLPSGLYYGQFALTDAVLPTLVLAWLLFVHLWIETGRLRWGVAASAIAAYSSWVHIRGEIIVLAYAGFLLFVAWRRWADRRDTAWSGGALVSGAILGHGINDWVKSHIYPGGVAPLGDWLVERLTSLDGLAWTFGLAAGKIWYLAVSTWGVAGAGLVVCVVVMARRPTPRALKAVTGLIGLVVVAIALVSSAAVPDEGTVANFVYGRYLACLAPVLFLAAGVFAMRAPRGQVVKTLLATVYLAVASAGVVAWYAGDRLSRDFFAAFDFPEICFLTGDWESLRLWQATGLTVLLITLAALLVGIGRRKGPAVVAAVFAALAVINISMFANGVTRYWQNHLETATSLAPAGLQRTDRVALDYRGMAWRVWVSQAYQVRTRLVPLNRYTRDPLPRDVTIVVVPWNGIAPAPSTWPAAPPNWRPVLSTRMRDYGWVAWRRSS